MIERLVDDQHSTQHGIGAKYHLPVLLRQGNISGEPERQLDLVRLHAGNVERGQEPLHLGHHLLGVVLVVHELRPHRRLC